MEGESDGRLVPLRRVANEAAPATLSLLSTSWPLTASSVDRRSKVRTEVCAGCVRAGPPLLASSRRTVTVDR